MKTGNSVPQLIAGENLLPYSAVTITGNRICSAAYFANSCVIGITDGSVSKYDHQFHATTGEPVSLQSGSIVVVRIRSSYDAEVNTWVCRKGFPLIVTPNTAGAFQENPWNNGGYAQPQYTPIQYVALETSSNASTEGVDQEILIWAMKTFSYNQALSSSVEPPVGVLPPGGGALEE